MNQAQMMQQLRKMQEQMAKVHDELANTVIEGTAGGGAVTVEINGEYQVKKIAIKPEAVDPDDIETLEDLLTVALNDALKRVQDLSSKKMGALTGGMRIPGLM